MTRYSFRLLDPRNDNDLGMFTVLNESTIKGVMQRNDITDESDIGIDIVRYEE